MTAADAPRWDAFVAASPDATFFHRSGWRRVIEDSFGHRCHFLLAERGGGICGILPLVHCRSFLFGNALSSLPFAVYGGPVAADAPARAALDAAAAVLMETLGADYLEYRNQTPTRPDWPCKGDLYATFRRPLEREPEKILLQIPRKQRAVVRKALAGDLRLTWDDEVRNFYPIYAASVRNLGTPVFGRRYFEILRHEFGGDCDIVTVAADGQPVTSVMNFYFKGTVLPYYAGGLPAARGNGAYDRMYYEIMCRAAERGCTAYDFGRSKAGTGAFAFKKNWGFEPQFLAYEYRLRNGVSLPEKNPLNPKYRLLIAAWQRLPLPVANLIGPPLARHLG